MPRCAGAQEPTGVLQSALRVCQFLAHALSTCLFVWCEPRHLGGPAASDSKCDIRP